MLMGYINGLVVLQIVAHPHRLLVTLVLCNASATEALPLFLDRLYNPAGAHAATKSDRLFIGLMKARAPADGGRVSQQTTKC